MRLSPEMIFFVLVFLVAFVAYGSLVLWMLAVCWRYVRDSGEDR